MGAITLLQSTDGGFASGATPQTTSSAGFAATTKANSLLVCVVWADEAGTSGTPTISTPVTSGFTWSLAESEVYTHSSTIRGRVSIYYIAGAAAMSTATTTTATAAAAGATNLNVEFSLYEFAAKAASLETESLGANATGTPSTIAAASLSTSHVDLIFVSMIGGTAAGTVGSGYTIGVAAAGLVGYGVSQYILQEASGTIVTSFGNSTTYWACVAAAFTVTAPTAAARAQADPISFF